MDIRELYPLENWATFDRVRPLRWDNKAILKALDYIRVIDKKESTYEALINDIKENRMGAKIALIYGALCSADQNINIGKFGNIYNNEYLLEYMTALSEGLEHYFPKTEETIPESLDESYPETPQPESGGFDWGYWQWISGKHLGINKNDFLNHSQRSIYSSYKAFEEHELGIKTSEDDPEGAF